jgi:hypothetical protein
MCIGAAKITVGADISKSGTLKNENQKSSATHRRVVRESNKSSATHRSVVAELIVTVPTTD